MPSLSKTFRQEQDSDQVGPLEVSLPVADDDTYDVRRIEMAGAVFPVILGLQPGESFRDAVYRATGENGFLRTRVAIRLTRPSSFRSLSAFTSLAESEDISRVVDMLGIRRDAEELHNILASREVRSRQYVSFFGHHLKRAHFSRWRRVSPRALRLAEHQRALWSIRWLSFDPETMESLIDRCPVCHSNLGWQMTRGVCFCHRCTNPKVDLRDYQQPLVECGDPEAMSFAIEIVDPLVSDATFRSRWPTAYPARSRAELFEFLIQLSMECQRNDDCRRGPVASISPKNLERAGRALLSWPAGLLELADGHSPIRNDTRMLRYLQADTSLSASVRADVKELLDARARRMALGMFQGVETREGTAKLVVPGARRANARTAMMELLKRPGQVRSGMEGAVRVIRDIRSIRLMSCHLGVSVPDVIDLYLSGFLKAVRPDMSMIGIDPEAIEEADIIEWLETHVPIVRNPKGMKLSAAKFAIDPGHSVSWPMLFRHALTGQLHLERGPASDKGLLHDLYVENFEGLESLCDMPGIANRFFDVSMSATEVGMALGKSRMLGCQLSRHFEWHSASTLRKLTAVRQSYAFSFELMDLCAMRGVKSAKISTVLNRAGISHEQIGKLTLWQRDAALSHLGLVRNPIDTP